MLTTGGGVGASSVLVTGVREESTKAVTCSAFLFFLLFLFRFSSSFSSLIALILSAPESPLVAIAIALSATGGTTTGSTVFFFFLSALVGFVATTVGVGIALVLSVVLFAGIFSLVIDGTTAPPFLFFLPVLDFAAST